jgi:hypothetical protein
MENILPNFSILRLKGNINNIEEVLKIPIEFNIAKNVYDFIDELKNILIIYKFLREGIKKNSNEIYNFETISNIDNFIKHGNINNISIIISDLLINSENIKRIKFITSKIEKMEKIFVNIIYNLKKIFDDTKIDIITFIDFSNLFINNGVLKNLKIWSNLYTSTYIPRKRYIQKIKGINSDIFESFIFNYDNGYDKLNVMVNVIEKENIKVSEHIFINRNASSLLYKKVFPFNSNRSANAKNIHLFALQTIRPNYLVSQPIDIMVKIFNNIMHNSIIKKININNSSNFFNSNESLIIEEIFNEEHFCYEYTITSKFFYRVII